MAKSGTTSAAGAGMGLSELEASRFDVVICGGGLAGLTLARQLARSMPERSVLVVERTSRPLDEAAHKVGESSVELGSQYFERLGLREYLRENHLIKFGLRFFPGGGQLPIEARTEIGPAQEPIVPSYQIDRGRFENDLRAMIEDDGVHLLEGAKVGGVEFGEGGEDDHRVEIAREGERIRVRARWVVDATGRASLLRKRLKSSRGTRHPANAGWFRLDGRVDIGDFAPESARDWHAADWAPHRWRSTNHLMGPGYWAWIIPLASDRTSIGVVAHDSHHGFDRVRSLERVLDFLREQEPQLAREISRHEILDFGCLRNYSHNSARCWSADRWAMVGEAGAFADPLYSPGSDFIGLANVFTEEMMRADFEHAVSKDALVERARELSAIYRSLVTSCVELYRDAAEVYGHADALLAKVYWDSFVYWAYTCQIFMQRLYQLKGGQLTPMMALGRRYAELTRKIQLLFDGWARLAPREPEGRARLMPGFPSVLIDAHLDLEKKLSPAEAIELMRLRLEESEEIAGELILRALDEVGEDQVETLVEHAGVLDWGVRIADERVAATGSVGLARRRTLRPLARDVERTLGRPPHKVSEATLRRVLGPILSAPVVESTQ